LLWDALDRATAPTSKPRKTKKAKASSSMPIFPGSPSNHPLLPPHNPQPESFKEANQIIQEAWEVAFPSLRFPVKFAGVFPSTKSPLVAVPYEVSHQEEPPALMQESTKGSSKLKVTINKNGDYCVWYILKYFKLLSQDVNEKIFEEE
jgi:hypothetical protein